MLRWVERVVEEAGHYGVLILGVAVVVHGAMIVQRTWRGAASPSSPRSRLAVATAGVIVPLGLALIGYVAASFVSVWGYSEECSRSMTDRGLREALGIVYIAAAALVLPLAVVVRLIASEVVGASADSHAQSKLRRLTLLRRGVWTWALCSVPVHLTLIIRPDWSAATMPRGLFVPFALVVYASPFVAVTLLVLGVVVLRDRSITRELALHMLPVLLVATALFAFVFVREGGLDWLRLDLYLPRALLRAPRE